MKANLRRIQKQRTYSDEFKKQLVSEFESGKYSVLELDQLYGVSYQSIYNWIYKFSIFNKKGYRIVEHQLSGQKKVKELEAKIKNLEASLGRKQIMIDYLEAMMEVAKEELDIDIKKNYATPPSKGLSKKK
ncbi:Transposase [Tenacibaculum sp. MAR_2009_124]|uniref:transposase n=1 Tax=Tenacibaculum sp. MAR_2009_124 TaxID=1250059 RepID=UPI0008950346|nr:transposase [Tenacibaculum sp. MAR_2009_124]SEB49755.1 Transposase [Tenacibaculum sp. MAR_2009_124]